MGKNKKYYYCAALVIVIVFFFLAFKAVGGIRSGTETVVTIDGERITREQFIESIKSKENDVFISYRNKYRVQINDRKFWETPVDGKRPIDTLRQAALDEITGRTVVLKEGKRLGLIDKISYADIKKSLDEENERRRIAIQKNETIYGPRQYNLKQYYDKVLSDLAAGIKKALSEKEFKLSQEDLKKKYDQNKEQYKKSDDIDVEQVSATAEYDGKSEDEQKVLNEIHDALSKGIDFDVLKTKFNDKIQRYKLVFERKTYNGDNISSRNTESLTIFDAIKNVPEGKVSKLISTSQEITFAKVVKRKQNGYKSLDEVNSSINTIYLDQKYLEYVDALIKEAKIEYNRKVFDNIYP